MSGVTGDVKKLFNFKYKVRNDSATDQYNRLLMVKALLVAAFLTGMNWYKDEIKCIVPKVNDGGVGGFVSQACWINGLYIYDELRDTKNFDGYYGIPDELDKNGTYPSDHITCEASPKDTKCKPMKKLFYLQYQWFPFFLAIMAFLYYLPYIVFRYVNNDLASLKNDIKSQSPDIDAIVKNYFNRCVNSSTRQMLKVVLNILIKILYLIVNICVFSFTDSVLNGDFKTYGSKWIDWSKLSNENAYNYINKREFIKAGEKLLPTFALCDVLEQGKDIKHTLTNEHRFVCEISQHILYHYVLIALWFLIILGMVVSCVGIVIMILEYALRSLKFAREEEAARKVFSTLSIREGEYLDFVRKKNVPVYGSLIRKLYLERFEDQSSKRSSIHKDTQF